MPPQAPAPAKSTIYAPTPAPAPSLQDVANLTDQRGYNAARFAPKDEDALERLATRWYRSGLLPGSYYPDAERHGAKAKWEKGWIEYGVARAVIVMRYGAALGVLPELAIRLIYIVEGQPAPAAALMLAMAFSAGVLRREDWRIAEAGPTKCRVELFGASRAKPEVVEASYEQYKHLHNKTNWKNYPEDMLVARATSRAMRRYFPDMFAGVYCAEERVDMRADKVAGQLDDAVQRILDAADAPPTDQAPPADLAPPVTGSDTIDPPVDVEKNLRAELTAATTAEQCATLLSRASEIPDEGQRRAFARDAAAKRTELGKGAA